MATVPGQTSKCANPKTAIPKHYGNTCTIWILPGIMVKPGLLVKYANTETRVTPSISSKKYKIKQQK